jgi:hypothetical protein
VPELTLSRPTDGSADSRGRPALALPRRSSAARALVAGAAGLLVATTVLVARASGLLEGVTSLAAAAVIALAVPTSAELSRRLLFASAVLVGWLPVLWWTPVLDVPFGRVAWLLALTAGAVAAWVVGVAEGAARRARRLVPRVRAVDLYPVLAGVVVAVLSLPMLRPRDPSTALAMLQTGWDHSAHADMVWMIREHGAVLGAIDAVAPAGGTWSYVAYPQGFHAIAAGLLELRSPQIGLPSTEIMLYTQIVALVVVACVVLVVAAVCSVPRLRQRPGVALLATTVLAGALVLGPGGQIVSGGFPPYFVALAALMAAPALVLSWPRVPAPVPLLALGGLILAVAHSWALLLVVLAPIALAIAFPLHPARWRAGRLRWAASAGVVVMTALGVAQAAALLLGGGDGIGDIVLLNGGIAAPDLGLVAVAPLLAVGASAWAWGRRRRTATDVVRREGERILVVAAGPAAGVVTAALIAGRLLLEVGELRYYFWKFAIGLVAASIAVAVVALVGAPTRLPGVAPRRRSTAVAVTACAVALTQVWGAALPPVGLLAPLATAPGALVVRDQLLRSTMTWPGFASALAAADARKGEEGRVVLLAYPRETFGDPVQLGQWYNALTGAWTDETNELLKGWFALDDTDEAAVRATLALLLEDPSATVLVAGGQVDAIREGVGPHLAPRVIEP